MGRHKDKVLQDAVELCRLCWEARSQEAASADISDGYGEDQYAGRYNDIRQKIRPRGDLRLLDVGCGRGSVLAHLMDDFRDVVGVDISAGNLQGLKATHASIQTHVASAHDLPFGDSSFERVLLYGVLHYMPTWDHAAQVVKELIRVCSVGGVVLIGDNEPLVNEAFDPPIAKQPQNPSLSRPGQVELCFTKSFFESMLLSEGHTIHFSDTWNQPGHFDVIIDIIK